MVAILISNVYKQSIDYKGVHKSLYLYIFNLFLRLKTLKKENKTFRVNTSQSKKLLRLYHSFTHKEHYRIME